jgi:hypothetical protein
MGNPQRLVEEMARKCRRLIEEFDREARGKNLPDALHPQHLLRMCDRIERNARVWSASRLHRWIGFVQCGMMANGMVDLTAARTMFDEAKNAWGTTGEDEDLTDHLDSGSSFEIDIGGQG